MEHAWEGKGKREAEGPTEEDAPQTMRRRTDDEGGLKMMVEAVLAADLVRVKQLVEEDPAAANEALNEYGSTPVWMAAGLGHLDVVRFLASEARADVNKAANGGITSVSIAAGQGHLEVVRFLAS